MVEDKSCKKIHDITLAYTFFKSEVEEGEEEGEGGVKLHGSWELPEGIKPPVNTAGLPAGVVLAAAAAEEK